MSLPTERIKLRKDENAAIRAGLDRMLNGFAEIKLGLRRAPEVLDSRVRDKFKPRALDEHSYALILDLRNRLADASALKATTHRLNCIEYSISAFAVRIGRNGKERTYTSELERKLENYRKRAKRATISKLGSAEYQSAQERWRFSLRWIRYYVLPMPLPRGPALKLRMRREQYREMFKIAHAVLSERCTEMPLDELISKFVKLAIAEIWRHRHPGIRVRDLIGDSITGKEFLFKFIEKRMDKRGTELQLKFDYMPWCVQNAIRTEKFKTLIVIDDSPADPVRRAPVTHFAPPALAAGVDYKQTAVPERPLLSEVSTSRPSIKAQDLADWLIQDVERGYWEDVIKEARHQLNLVGPRRQQTMTSDCLADIQTAFRPPSGGSDALDYINSTVDWLLSWISVVENDAVRIRNLFAEGLQIATATYKPLDNPPHPVDGGRYIQGTMRGTFSS